MCLHRNNAPVLLGELERCEVRTNFAFVTFIDERDAVEAKESLHDTDIDGQRINIEWTKESGRYEGRPRSGNCYECNEPGHIARNCPRGGSGGGGRGGGYRGDRRDDRYDRRDDRYDDRRGGRGGYGGGRDDRRRSRSRSRSPRRDRRSRSRSPVRNRDDKRDRRCKFV